MNIMISIQKELNTRVWDKTRLLVLTLMSMSSSDLPGPIVRPGELSSGQLSLHSTALLRPRSVAPWSFGTSG